MAFSYIVEHMEDDERTPSALPPWVKLEYAHMRTLAGTDAHIHFTHLSPASTASLTSSIQSTTDGNLADAQCHTQGVLDLMQARGISLDRVCLLDPKAKNALSPGDGDSFKWFLFGGILGDDPPRDRTSELRVLGFPSRHLGPVQMTTDTALGVTKIVVHDKIPLDQICYIDYPTIQFNAKESVEMPFRYIAENGEPKLPPGMRQLLHEDLNKSFDF